MAAATKNSASTSTRPVISPKYNLRKSIFFSLFLQLHGGGLSWRLRDGTVNARLQGRLEGYWEGTGVVAEMKYKRHDFVIGRWRTRGTTMGRSGTCPTAG